MPESELSEDLQSLERKFRCTSEMCVMQSLGRKDLIAKYFKPVTKSYDNNHWLNNTEIDSVQFQLMQNYPGYHYSNIHMIDLEMFDPSNDVDYTPENVKDIDFIKLINNGDLKTYGMVVNTDVSSGRGIHWFAIFIDARSPVITIEYFNSSGFDIKSRDFKMFFIKLADKIQRGTKRECKFIKVSDIQHQKSTTSNCGVYALFYLWKRLGGTPMEYFKDKKISDEHVVTFREFFFRLH